MKDLFVRVNDVPKEKGKIFLIHGLGEHSGRYKKFINFINSKGYSVIAPDLPGFGKSPGKRGHVSSFGVYYNIIDKLMDENKTDNLIVMGHSMGGLIAVRFSQVTHHKVNTLVISGAATRLKKISAGLTFITKMLDSISPSITFSNKIDPNDLSYNEESNKAYIDDPLVHDKISARLFWEMKRESEKILKNMDKLTMPTLVIHGRDDPLVSPEFSQEFFDYLKSEKKELKFIQNAKHESMNEKDGEKVFEMIYNFLQKVNDES